MADGGGHKASSSAEADPQFRGRQRGHGSGRPGDTAPASLEDRTLSAVSTSKPKLGTNAASGLPRSATRNLC